MYWLDLTGQSDLTTLNMSGCTGLDYLDASAAEALVTLDASGCTALTMLELSGLSALTTLNMSGCSALQWADGKLNTSPCDDGPWSMWEPMKTPNWPRWMCPDVLH